MPIDKPTEFRKVKQEDVNRLFRKFLSGIKKKGSEPNQARWVGIRPTSLGEKIPVEATDFDIRDLVGTQDEVAVVDPDSGAGLTVKKAGWINSYEDTYEFRDTATAGTGLNHMDTPVIGTGKTLMVTFIYAQDTTNQCSSIYVRLRRGGVWYAFDRGYPSTDKEPLILNGLIPLKDGDYIRISFYGCINNDSLAITVIGYYFYS